MPIKTSCLDPAACVNPALRVEAQVLLVVNDPSVDDFARYSYDGNVVNGYHQARPIPSSAGAPVHFLGSTTGPDFSGEVCSPPQVSWSVRPTCTKLDIGSLGRGCLDNVFKEDHGHGMRRLVVEPWLLSGIEQGSGGGQPQAE